MRRKPSAEVGRSESTAELIARISAERDAPVESTGRHAVLTAPPRTARATARTAVTRPRAVRPVDDESAVERTGPIDLPGPVPLPRDGTRRAVPRWEPAVEEDVLFDPEADDTPTTVLQFLSPDPPAPRRPVRMLVSVALVAVAMVVVGAAAAGWLGGTGAEAPASLTAVTEGVVPRPAPTGPTVPAPVDSAPVDSAPVGSAPVDSAPAEAAPAPEEAAPEEAADPAPADVPLIDGAPDSSGYY
ncbi:hypothetical protein [Pseudonocardia hydrocarbonoxydans]|nr:hypothetical protein [Pseudonocardia hydrocarbonoxydans]